MRNLENIKSPWGKNAREARENFWSFLAAIQGEIIQKRSKYVLYTRIFEPKILENIKNPFWRFGDFWKLLRAPRKKSEIFSLKRYVQTSAIRIWGLEIPDFVLDFDQTVLEG